MLSLYVGDLPSVVIDHQVTQLGFRNYATGALTPEKMQVAGLGLGFIPTPHVPDTVLLRDTMSDVRRFTRKVCLADYFKHSTQTTVEAPGDGPCPQKFSTTDPNWMPTDWKPSTGVLEYIWSVRETVYERIRSLPKRTSTNFCYKFRTALREMQDAGDKVFAICDKNLGMAAIDTSVYRAEALKWLYKTHERVADSALEVVSKTLTALHTAYVEHLDDWDMKIEHQCWVTRWCKASLKGPPRGGSAAKYLPPAFKIMPKAHKSPLEWRPLTGQHTWATQPAALLTAWLLLALVMLTTAYVKDSDFIARLLAHVIVAPGELLFVCDVTKLYPSILHGHCVTTIRWYLHRKGFHRTEFVCDLIAIILAYNYCEFDGELWRQVVGYGTGVANGAEVANLYLAAMEERQLVLHLAEIVIFRRFIDDGMGVWRGTETGLREMLGRLYEGSGLSLTIEVSEVGIVFLDMFIFVDGCQLLTKCYQKPSNAYLYLPYGSEHPPHVWYAFLRGELIRYVKRCSLFQDFQDIVNLFVTRLTARGYHHRELARAFKTVSFSKRDEYLAEKTKKPDTRSLMTFVTTFSRLVYNSGLQFAFKENSEWLRRLPHFKDVNFIMSWRAAGKLGRLLVTSQFPKKRRAAQLDMNTDASQVSSGASTPAGDDFNDQLLVLAENPAQDHDANFIASHQHEIPVSRANSSQSDDSRLADSATTRGGSPVIIINDTVCA